MKYIVKKFLFMLDGSGFITGTREDYPEQEVKLIWWGFKGDSINPDFNFLPEYSDLSFEKEVQELIRALDHDLRSYRNQFLSFRREAQHVMRRVNENIKEASIFDLEASEDNFEIA